MIKEKDLVPGRVITSLETRRSFEGLQQVVVAWMVIGFQEQVKRRHQRSKAPRDEWHVLLLRFGGGDRVLNDVVITPASMAQWKRLF
jgi:hypothetical protein